jgi:4-amino-4-deoxy-L-arabinose transferase-like glycosyltransferase
MASQSELESPRSRALASMRAPRALSFGLFKVSRRTLLWSALVCLLLEWTLMGGRAQTASYVDVVLIWLLGIILGLLAMAPDFEVSSWWPRLVDAVRANKRDLLLAGVVGLAALAVRAAAIGTIPYVFGGDEGSLTMPARDVLEGRLTNPFATGWYSTPTMFMFMQAGAIAVLGDSVGGARLSAAILGALAVFVTYLVTTRLFGRWIGLAAAVLLAVFHYHVHFSRLAANHVIDALFIVLTLMLIERAVYEGRRVDSVLLGLLVGFAQYFYLGARIIPLVVLACLVFALVRPHETRLAELRPVERLRALLGTAAVVVFGAALVYMPLLAFYNDHPAEFNARIGQVSIFASGWLSGEQVRQGRGAIDLITNQIWRAALLPFQTVTSGWYAPGAPLVGMPMVVLSAFGLVLTTIRFLDRRHFGLAVAYWGAVVGLGLTEDPTQTQRFIIAAPLLAIFAALGLGALVSIGTRLVGLRPSIAYAAVAAVVAVIAVWNYQHYFLNDSATRYGGENGLVATEMAYYLRDLGGAPTVYFAGPPRMWYYGFQSLPFIARDARGINVEQPWSASSPRPTLTGPTVFVFLNERAVELHTVRDLFPNGTTREVRSPPKEGPSRVLFVAYEVSG